MFMSIAASMRLPLQFYFYSGFIPPLLSSPLAINKPLRLKLGGTGAGKLQCRVRLQWPCHERQPANIFLFIFNCLVPKRAYIFAVKLGKCRLSRMELVALVARTGRHRQRYDQGFRLVAGCIPYRYNKSGDACNGNSLGTLEVLMVTPLRGEGLMFPKGGWEIDETKEEAACRETLEEAGVKGDIEFPLGSWDFISKRHRDEHSLEGFRKSYMFALAVTEQLDSWPEKDVRQRKWVTVTVAMDLCRKGWMREALEKCVCHLSGGDIISNSSSESVDGFTSSDSLSQLSDDEPTEQSACQEMVSSSAVAAIGSIDAISDDEAPSLLTEENASSSSE